MSDNKIIFLLSSNASKEYMLDMLEVLALPFGMVQHFRYQLKRIGEELKEKLPLKDITKKNPFKNYKVVICYLYQEKTNQEKTNNGWKWIKIYPVRTGVLMDAYKTGEKDEDIAHFYFKVDAYIPYDKGNKIVGEIKEWNDIWNKTYAFLGKNLKNNINTLEKERYSAFHKICTSFKKEHFRSPEGNIEYYPVFCLIEGLKTFKKNEKNKETLTPEYDPLTHKSYYTIVENSRYSFEFRTFFPEEPPEFQIIVESDKKLFSTPPKYEFKISSRYTEENCALISRFLESDAWTGISYITELKESGGKKPLNISINFPIKIVRKRWYRFLEALSDIGFGIGTGAIALRAASMSFSDIPSILKFFSSWWTIVVAYFIWALLKVIIKLQRG